MKQSRRIREEVKRERKRVLSSLSRKVKNRRISEG
jgi:hypothetical protein